MNSLNRMQLLQSPDGYLTEPQAEKLPPTFSAAITQLDALSTQSPNTVNAEVYFSSFGYQKKEIDLGDYPSPILHVESPLGSDQDTAFSKLQTSVEATTETVLGVELPTRAVGHDWHIAKRTLLIVKAQGRMCLAQALSLPPEEAEYFGTFAQLTVDMEDRVVRAHTTQGIDLSDLGIGVVGPTANVGDYVTYDWRIGGHVMKYLWNGDSYMDHVNWIDGDEDGFQVSDRAMNPDEPYDQARYPRIDTVTQRQISRMIETAVPYVGDLNNHHFPPHTI